MNPAVKVNMIMISSSNSFHRPFQSSSSSSSGAALLAQNGKPGRILLQLIRSRDKLILGKKKKSTKTRESFKVDVVVDGNDEDADDYDNDTTNDEGINENELVQVEDEILSLLSSLHASIRRCGLFANDVEKATAFYNCAADRSSLNNNVASTPANTAATTTIVESSADNSKKRKRKKGGGGGGGMNNSGTGSLSASSYGIYLDSINTKDAIREGGGGEKKHDLDEGLILTAICKILGVHVGRKKKIMEEKEDEEEVLDKNIENTSSSHHYYGCNILCAALNILSSLCDHAKDGMVVPSLIGNTTCASIECDMIGSIGIHLLDALHENIAYWYSFYTTNFNLQEEEMVLHPLIGSLRASASVVCLLETRLSRADKTMQNIKEITWMVLNNMPTIFVNNNNLTVGDTQDNSSVQDGVRNAATVLLASLVLAGNSEGMPPSKIWSQNVADAILLLRWAILDFFPMPNVTSFNNKSGRGEGARQKQLHPTAWNDHMKWMELVKEVIPHGGELDLGKDTTSIRRSRALLSRIQCLTKYIQSLLRMEGYPLHRLPNNMPSLIIHLPLDSLLDVSEILLSFPLAAEATHRSTKSRLRSTPVADGLISPNTAMEIAPDLRLCGHDLMNIIVESCRGGSGVRGRARRVVGIAVATLQSSCSLALVSVLDGSGGGGDGSSSSRVSKIGSWLRGSIPLRIEAIRTFHVIAISLGSGVMSSTGTAKSVARALVLLGGCLLEQVQESGSEMDDEWGTLGEKAKLIESASNALAACIAAFGGLIPSNVRGTLDSITQTCFSKLYSVGNSSILSYSHVKQAMLKLGMNCICVPWQDGGRSTLSNIVRIASEVLRNDPDVSVASAALSTLCVFDAFATPRAPPILVPTRESINESGYHGTNLTASSMLAGMNDSKLDMLASKNAAEERRVAKSEKKSSKIAKKEAVKTETNAHPKPNEKIVENCSDLVRESVEENSGDVAADTAMELVIDGSENNTMQKDERQIENMVEAPMIETQQASDCSMRDDNCDELESSQVDAENSDDEASKDSIDEFPDIVDEGPDDEDKVDD